MASHSSFEDQFDRVRPRIACTHLLHLDCKPTLDLCFPILDDLTLSSPQCSTSSSLEIMDALTEAAEDTPEREAGQLKVTIYLFVCMLNFKDTIFRVQTKLNQ